jgi:hypothetical protein
MGFEGFESIASLRKTRLAHVPDVPGVYLVLRPALTAPTFLPTSTGGHFRGRDPTVPVSQLSERWVPSCLVCYVGKAGGDDNSSTLRSRLRQYLRFGAGVPCGHWGGRYIWQLADAESLLIAWAQTPTGEPRALDERLLAEFASAHGRPPFANRES